MLGADARAGDDPPPPPVRPRGAGAEPARGRDRAGRPGQGHRRPPRRQRREPPGDRGVHAGGQRGGRLVPHRAPRRLPPPGARRPRAAQARRSSPSSPAASGWRSTSRRAASSSSAILTETAGKPEEYAVHYGLLAQPEAGDLHARARGALRAGQRRLLPLHLADPPLSRPPGPSPAHRDPGGQEAARATSTS